MKWVQWRGQGQPEALQWGQCEAGGWGHRPSQAWGMSEPKRRSEDGYGGGPRLWQLRCTPAYRGVCTGVVSGAAGLVWMSRLFQVRLQVKWGLRSPYFVLRHFLDVFSSSNNSNSNKLARWILVWISFHLFLIYLPCNMGSSFNLCTQITRNQESCLQLWVYFLPLLSALGRMMIILDFSSLSSLLIIFPSSLNSVLKALHRLVFHIMDMIFCSVSTWHWVGV